MFARLFGRKSEAPTSTGGPSTGAGPRNDPHAALHKLDETIELTQKRMELLEKKIEQETAKAKAHLAKGNKKAAMMCLKQKKMFEAQVEQLGNVVLSMMDQKTQLESMSHAQEVVQAQRIATDQQKKYMKTMNADEVANIQDEQEDIKANFEEVMQAMGSGYAMEDPDLEAELEELEQQGLEKELLETPNVPNAALPSVPSKAPAQPTEEDELEALQREMGLNAA